MSSTPSTQARRRSRDRLSSARTLAFVSRSVALVRGSLATVGSLVALVGDFVPLARSLSAVPDRARLRAVVRGGGIAGPRSLVHALSTGERTLDLRQLSPSSAIDDHPESRYV